MEDEAELFTLGSRFNQVHQIVKIARVTVAVKFLASLS